MSDSRKISMKDVLHLLSADTNPIHPPYKVTCCLHAACTASPRSTLMEIKNRTCCPRSTSSYSCLIGQRLLWTKWFFFYIIFLNFEGCDTGPMRKMCSLRTTEKKKNPALFTWVNSEWLGPVWLMLMYCVGQRSRTVYGIKVCSVCVWHLQN